MLRKTVPLFFQNLQSLGICLDLLFSSHSSVELLKRLAQKRRVHVSDFSCFKLEFQNEIDEKKADIWKCCFLRKYFFLE